MILNVLRTLLQITSYRTLNNNLFFRNQLNFLLLYYLITLDNKFITHVFNLNFKLLHVFFNFNSLPITQKLNIKNNTNSKLKHQVNLYRLFFKKFSYTLTYVFKANSLLNILLSKQIKSRSESKFKSEQLMFKNVLNCGSIFASNSLNKN